MPNKAAQCAFAFRFSSLLFSNTMTQRLIFTNASGASRALELTKERTHIGRRIGVDIRVDEPGVPPSLGFLVSSLGDVFAVAEKDDTPFLINGFLVTRRKLEHGDTLSIGSCFLRFEKEEQDAASLADDLLSMAHRLLSQQGSHSLELGSLLDASLRHGHTPDSAGAQSPHSPPLRTAPNAPENTTQSRLPSASERSDAQAQTLANARSISPPFGWQEETIGHHDSSKMGAHDPSSPVTTEALLGLTIVPAPASRDHLLERITITDSFTEPHTNHVPSPSQLTPDRGFNDSASQDPSTSSSSKPSQIRAMDAQKTSIASQMSLSDPRQEAMTDDALKHSLWPHSAWGVLEGLAGGSKGQKIWLDQDLKTINLSGHAIVITKRHAGYFITTLLGLPPLVNRQKVGQASVLLEDGAIIGFGNSVFKFQLKPV